MAVRPRPPRANEGVWRYLLTEGTQEDLAGTRGVLAEFLDRFARSGTDLRLI